MTLKIKVMAIFWVVLMAAGEVRSEPEGFPFGLEKLRWNMTVAEARAQLSALAPEEAAPPGTPRTNQDAIFAGPYPWKSCAFDLALHFSRDALSSIWLTPRQYSQFCLIGVREELIRQFGKSNSTDQDHLEWHATSTDAFYNSGRVNLSLKGSPGLIILDSATPLPSGGK